MAIILPNPQKAHPVDYTIGKENGTSEAFIGFLTYLIAKCFLLHNEFLVMDNATIHSCGNAQVIEDMLWDTIVDGHLLHILVIYLPTRSPELNPIKLVFHILAMRICSYWYPTAGPCNNAYPSQGGTSDERHVVCIDSPLLCTLWVLNKWLN
jgi:transposase